MESSFFEYRNETETYSGSEEEVIDNSLIDDSLSGKKKNHTVFVAESEESTSEDESEPEASIPKNTTKSVVKQRNIVTNHIISSSDDDSSRRGSIRRQSESLNKLVLSSSDDEDQASPEMVPKRRPPPRKSSINSNNSFIGRKTKKRIMQLDSDTENSIIIEHDKHKKLLCMKNTPLKINDGMKDKSDAEHSIAYNDSMVYEGDDNNESNDGTNDDNNNDDLNETNKTNDKTNGKCKTNASHHKTTESHNDSETDNDKTNESVDNEAQSGEEVCDDSDEGPDEDQMVMSRATRMSIMGVVPQGSDSDESDFIQSDESNRNSHGSSNSLSELPEGLPTEVQEHTKTPEKATKDPDDSQLTCSPFSSPLQDITNKSYNKRQSDDECTIIIDTMENQPSAVKNKVETKKRENFIKYDDDVTIIDTKPEVIALSSDDEDEMKESKSPKKSPKLPKQEPQRPSSQNIKQYLAPPSYPSQQVVYVKKHQRETELLKYEALKEDLKNVRYLLEEMDVDTLPDRGSKLIERLSQLEEQFRRQGDKVASMIVEPDKPTAIDIARDGFGKDKEGLTWDEIQKASNAVQPRMFGKQAMATHMAERHLILDRLRDLHASLGSRPSESQQAGAPASMLSTLLGHQLHALAWLQWRETQRPRAGILADDMGLGKTITMISLIVSDKQGKIDDDDDDDDDEPRSKLIKGGTLVVCPASLIQQWGGEVTKHVKPHVLSVCLHHGPNRAVQPARLATQDLVVTTYNIMQRDHEKNGVLMKIRWRRVILDEAHIVRNYKSATCGAVTSLHSTRRWCLTGTPVQNKDLDLFALLKFLKCSPFDDLTMWKKWIDNKSLGGQERLSTIMQCLLLRRTKVQLQQRGQLDCLPEKHIHQQHVTLSQPEMNVYQKVLVTSKTLFAQFLHQRAEKNNDAQGFAASRKDDQYAKMHKKMIALQGVKPVKSHEILVLLLRLRQVCCHCGLIAAMLDADGDDDAAGTDLLEELNKLSLEDSKDKRKSKQSDDEEDIGPVQEGGTAAEAIRSVLSSNNPVFNLNSMSSKIQAVMECLRENVFVNKGDKAVVVSQWTSVLRLVEQELKKDRIKSVTLSGNVPVPARPALIQAINDPRSDVKVMLLSLCAGGVGLNLCGASHLLLLDPHWNPQLEQQAQDRVYRVGQPKDVHIYRFMCVDTVEQTIRKLQEAKLELAENVLTGAKNTNNSKLTIEDLKMLFNMGQ